MKNIEQLIKESLENHELPYNEAAWESMSKRLDGTSPSPFYRKWWVAASIGTVLVGSALFFTMNSQSESAGNTQKDIPALTQNIKNSQTTKQNRKAAFQHTVAPQTNTLHTKEKQTDIHQESNMVVAQNYSRPAVVHPSSNPKDEPVKKETEGLQSLILATKPTPTDVNSSKPNILPVTFNKPKYCVGDEVEITNPNENLVVQVIQNEKNLLTIKPSSKKTFTASSEGMIEVQSGNQKQTAIVYGTTTDLYIHVDPTLIYENAIPAVRFSVSGNDNPVHWSVEKHASEVENGTFVVHPYKGTDIEVTVSSKDQNGCTVTEKKIISIPEEYKLNASKALDINSTDPRVATFMPFVLTKRNTPFELYIYDARSGRVIFKTTDPSNGWNGVDSNTGELLKNGSTVLWKVILGNPNPGEPREYNGTLVLKTE
ncbi:hypothetical protein [Fluviicola sp.]|jgi:hypothetical protein|uniref:hypothetical protein n=1 Tax=Fluviicola sp. TaxID=1917219 RepID=UPI00281C01CE|nr:hypothetical protein [Fluviicola sp.]MDR0800949.1 hypothetical protein [Fluviicola sp.]